MESKDLGVVGGTPKSDSPISSEESLKVKKLHSAMSSGYSQQNQSFL